MNSGVVSEVSIEHEKHELQDLLSNEKHLLGRKDEFDFWKTNGAIYPEAYKVFLQNRCIRPSSAKLESVFSEASAMLPIRSSSTSTQKD